MRGERPPSVMPTQCSLTSQPCPGLSLSLGYGGVGLGSYHLLNTGRVPISVPHSDWRENPVTTQVEPKFPPLNPYVGTDVCWLSRVGMDLLLSKKEDLAPILAPSFSFSHFFLGRRKVPIS